MSQELVKTDVNIAQFSPENLISQAIDKALPVETMEKLLMMRRELKAEFAKEEFDSAMSRFQADCPIIEKNKSGPNGVYKYAPLEEIVKQVKKELEKNGFSYSILTNMTAEKVKVTCVAKHKLGHSESSDVELPLANKTGMMNAPQQTAATMTYAKRYAFCNAFGIMTGDEDTDAIIDIRPLPNTQSLPANQPVQKTLPTQTTPPTTPTKKTCPNCKTEHMGQYPTCYDCYMMKRNGITPKTPEPTPNDDTPPFP